MSHRRNKLKDIDRRTFLRGLGGAVVSLPLFDFLLNPAGLAYAQAALPKRFLILTNGISLTQGSLNVNHIVPTRVGTGYDLFSALAPIGNYTGLQNYVSVYSNLRMPFTAQSSSAAAPTAGYKGDFHVAANRCQLTGKRTQLDGDRKLLTPGGPSADQLLKAAFNPTNRYVHANYCVQPKGYIGNSLTKRSSQFGPTGTEIGPQVSPRAAFNELFFNLQDSDPAAEAQRRLAIEKRQSVIDLLDQERLNFLNRELSAKERTMLTDHFDHIRTLENSLAQESQTTAGVCVKPRDPGPDPALGSDYANGVFSDTSGYSSESARANIFVDLLAMALACDIVRHGTLRVTYSQSWMNSRPISQEAFDYHQLSHSNRTAAFVRMLTWHVDVFSKLASKLQNTREGTGNVLDNTVMLLCSEGGGGINSDDGGGNAPHSGHNMATLVAGKVGGIRTGRHVRTSELHPSAVILSAMKAVGYTGNSLGDVSALAPEFLP